MTTREYRGKNRKKGKKEKNLNVHSPPIPSQSSGVVLSYDSPYEYRAGTSTRPFASVRSLANEITGHNAYA